MWRWYHDTTLQRCDQQSHKLHKAAISHCHSIEHLKKVHCWVWWCTAAAGIFNCCPACGLAYYFLLLLLLVCDKVSLSEMCRRLTCLPNWPQTCVSQTCFYIICGALQVWIIIPMDFILYNLYKVVDCCFGMILSIYSYESSKHRKMLL